MLAGSKQIGRRDLSSTGSSSSKSPAPPVPDQKDTWLMNVLTNLIDRTRARIVRAIQTGPCTASSQHGLTCPFDLPSVAIQVSLSLMDSFPSFTICQVFVYFFVANRVKTMRVIFNSILNWITWNLFLGFTTFLYIEQTIQTQRVDQTFLAGPREQRNGQK